MFNDLDYLNGELHRKELLEQSHEARLVNCHRQSHGPRAARGLQQWFLTQVDHLRLVLGVAVITRLSRRH